MPRRVRSSAEIVGRREAMAIGAILGGQARVSRRAKRCSIAQVARRVGLSVARLSEIERGHGARAPLETWVALGIALDRPLAVHFSRSHDEASTGAIDAGHLEIQEFLLRRAGATGRPGTFEVPTRPSDPRRSTDVGIRDPALRTRILAECWNTFGDLGAAVRATRRKQFEAAAAWPEDRIATVWIVRATAANRTLLARYPAIIDAAFPGSSRRWVRALTEGGPPPGGTGHRLVRPQDATSDRAAPRYHRGVTQPDTLHISTHPAALHKLGILRDEKTEPKKFREVVRELSWLIGYEALQDAKTRPLRIKTPNEEMDASELGERIGLVPILRAGLGMVDAMLELMPTAQVWHLGLFRDERTLRPVEYYNKLPDSATVDLCLILDPMLATGGSATAAIDVLKRWGAVTPVRIKLVNLIAAPEGVAAVQQAHPDVEIHCAALDRGLNEKGYIIPGLGDAGDRQFGTGNRD